MRLDSVTLQGFKSFPERTEIKFHPGVTAIVGPNGSGKSNVTDAIRWVLGEQSAKTLRGSKMEDVIFSGTELRRPVSFCEVVLKLDNQDYTLAIDASEVEVTRRLYRSGESLYQINRQDCRLRDIVELFMDTGIGREGYSIVGQGRIDEVLSNKSEDRRRIFDEAAGISRYKARRDEAQRKLTATELELQRAEDLLMEMERQMRPLSKQAESAKIYLKLEEEFRSLDLALLFREMDSIEEELQQFDQQNASFDDDLTRSEEQEAKLNQSEQSMKKRVAELEQEDETLILDRESAVEDLQMHRSRIQLLQSRLEQVREQEGSRKARMQNARERLTELEAQRQQHAAIITEQEAQSHVLRDAFNETESLLEQSTLEREELRAFEHSVQNRIRDAREALLERRHQLALLDQETGQASKAEEQLAHERSMMAATLESAQTEHAHYSKQYDQVEAELASKRDGQKQLEESTQKGRDQLIREEASLREAEAKEQQRLYRLRTLESLRDSLEGYHESVRRLLNHVRDHELSDKIHGPLGDLIQVASGYEIAIETALGGAIQNVVVKDSRTAGQLIEILKRDRLGRVTFLPLENISTGGLNDGQIQQAHSASGYLGVASELVTYDPIIQAAVRNTLARTIVMKDLDSANRLARATNYRVRIVTLDGEIIMPGGALTGGSRKQQQTLLSRPREIEELRSEGLGYEEWHTKQQASIRELRIAVASSDADTKDLIDQIRRLEQEKVSLDAQKKQSALELERTTQRLDRLKDEVGDLERQREVALMDRKAIQIEVEALETELFQAEQDAIEVDARIKECSERIQQQRDDVSQRRATHAAMVAELQSARQLSEHYLSEIKQHQSVLDSFASEHHSGEAMASKISEELEHLQGTTGAKEHLLTELTEKREQVQTHRRALTSELQVVREELSRMLELKQSLEVQKARLQVRKDALRDRLDATRNRLWEDYELTFANRDAWIQEDLKEGPAKKRLSELREQIRSLGSVNVNAVEEYKEVSERYEFMTEQIKDIQESRQELERLIRQITGSMREAFEESFEFIRREFALVFTQLFNGGEADILLSDTSDILSSDIEIKVSPPGKKLQNMLLLSGGERSLCAIALIFALQRLRPAPFCILDEVEAALDDANIFRFNDYVREQAEQIQFILVTHRKGTMEAADRLYGVTMQERGISRMLSLQLS